MKIQSYERKYDKNIVQVKRYLLNISRGNEEIHEIINSCLDVYSLKKKINHQRDIQSFVFSSIKSLIDESEDLDDMEIHLVYMNILIDNNSPLLLTYKYNLLNFIVTNGGINIKTYCLVRHLIKYSSKILPRFIDSFLSTEDMSLERYHYLTTYILLIEKEYKLVYDHLEYISIDEVLEKYLPALYNYSPRLYRRYFINDLQMGDNYGKKVILYL